jgi:hypothetical protein
VNVNPERSFDEKDVHTAAPTGLYVVSAILLLGVVALIYYALVAPSYRIFAVIFGPFLLYAGIGLVPRWRGARAIAIVLFSLTLLLAILNLGALLFLDMADELGQEGVLRLAIQNGIRLIVLPVVLVFLLGKRVRTYYARST